MKSAFVALLSCIVGVVSIVGFYDLNGMAVLIPQWGNLHHYGINYSSAKEMVLLISKRNKAIKKIYIYLWGHKGTKTHLDSTYKSLT